MTPTCRLALRSTIMGWLVVAVLSGGQASAAATESASGHPSTTANHTGSVDVSDVSSASMTTELQPILDEAEPGSTIVLKPGIYLGPAVIRKPLELRSEIAGESILLNESEESALIVEADDVTLAGIRIRDEAFKPQATIVVSGDRARIEQLWIATGADGIAVKDADNGTITSTVIDWTPREVSMAAKGNGIDLFNSHRWRIDGNTVSDAHDGIYMEKSDDTIVTGNVVERSRYGIHCMYTARTVIRGNVGNANVTGAMVMTATEVEVNGNTFTKQNENVHSQGILLFDAHDSVFEDNKVEGNRTGFYVEQSTGNVIVGNEVIYNFVGIQLLDAERNVVEGNLFQGNVADAQARGSSNNEIAGNYWDGFSGIDTDGDGYSDTAYAINPFFQGVTQKRAAFQLFFQSPGMEFLEELFQNNRDDWSRDVKPLLAPPGFDGVNPSHGSSKATVYLSLLLTIAVIGMLYMNRRRTI
ncbi:nitrous oxide reductase family maturation protein NosD [Paenibacillus sp. MY03]|uniref:right-handed parallel beta-helix repeat-containing protein n=1 Tax=Paenibacillus sp. MY03 TaxID=302980 RepID=UPI00211AF448|nr:NosD domain-containing protein [Paenibacillus sp. MY03]